MGKRGFGRKYRRLVPDAEDHHLTVVFPGGNTPLVIQGHLPTAFLSAIAACSM
jgi:hypothetical protein